MHFIQALIKNKAWVAHLLGLVTLTGAEYSDGATNPYLLGAISLMTSVFHICDTLKAVATPRVSVDPAPVSDAIRNAGGDTQVFP